MQVTLTIPDELAAQLQPHSKGGYSKFSKLACANGTLPRRPTRGSASVLETLARLPAPEDVLALGLPHVAGAH